MEDSHHNYKTFMGFTRNFKVTKAEPPLDVVDAFRMYGHDDKDSSHMDAAHLRRFMVDFQGQDDVSYSENDAKHLLDQILHRRRHLYQFVKKHLSLEDFFFFLFSDELNGPLNTQVHQDMTAPMQHYFIYTGHNSYLTGNQLSSDCSDVPIIKALKQGVRVIELDIWPNSTKDDVNVLHGGTLTAPVKLIKCLKSIKQHAFDSSSYPVIITLEDHLTPDLQDKVAKMMIEVFGEMLFIPEPEHLKQFPSPEELKFHVMLSTKPPKEYLEEKQSKEEGISSPAFSSRYGDGDDDGDGDGDGDGDAKSIIEIPDDDDNNDNDQDNEEIIDSGNKRSSQPESQVCKNEETDSGDKKLSQLEAPKCKNKETDSGDKKSSQLEAPECKNKETGSGDKKSSQLEASECKNKETEYQLEAPECKNKETNSGDKKPSQLEALECKNKETDSRDKKSSQLEARECKKEEIDSGHNKSSKAEAAKCKNEEIDSGDNKSSQTGAKADSKNEENDTGDGNSSQSGAPHYKRLIAIHAGKPLNGLREAFKAGLRSEKIKRLSLSEQELERAAAYYGEHVVRFTQKNFLRIYPKGTRITSTNYKPVIGWMHGAQMVAFNMQGYGKSLWCMHGMFRSNGGCGYVKKPDFLMEKGLNDEVFDPKAPAEVKKILKIKVYMSDGWRMDFGKTHFDTFSPPDFYVKLCIIGVAADYAQGKTRVIEDDWIPIWDEVFTFKLTVPELALLRIEVCEYDLPEKDDFGGQTCLPVSELRTGIRSVPLYDKKGDKMPSVRLLMSFQFLDTTVLESLTSPTDSSSEKIVQVEDGIPYKILL